MKKLISVFFVLCLLACIPLNPPLTKPNNPFHSTIKTAYISHLFTADEKENILWALGNFTCSTEYKVITFNIVDNVYPAVQGVINPDYSIIIEKVYSSDPRIVSQDRSLGPKTVTVGLYTTEEDNIPIILLVADRINNDDLWKRTALHEILHFIGLHTHSESKDSAVYPQVDKGAERITNYDLDRIRKLYSFSSKEFHVCN